MAAIRQKPKISVRLQKYGNLKKILIIRFSSIGDIVLTTPVVRCLKNQLPGVEIHYCTKKQYSDVLSANPYIDHLHYLDESVSDLAVQLKKENFDFVIDLHNSLRSKLLRLKLHRPSGTFRKLNIEKWLLVNFKINRLPAFHIVDRYFEAAHALNLKNDKQGLDFFIPEADQFDPSWLPATHQQSFIGFVIGGRHNTKIFPIEKVAEVCNLLKSPVALLGGKEDVESGETIAREFPHKVFNACGLFSLTRSAALVKQAGLIITNDTGLMHVAAAFNKKIISLWGNTVPVFGMYPYLPQESENKSVVFEVKGLKCRPCSKIGFKKCPEKHFDCMNRLDATKIAETANQMMNHF
ncbi:MAG: glycosyltransferase family 9 protein [Bacteroidales bacterium]|nr:glycosyltransferase family 9 protein [Bacteroidales bacterium]